MGGAKAFDAHTQVKTQGWGKRGERDILSLIKTFLFTDIEMGSRSIYVCVYVTHTYINTS